MAKRKATQAVYKAQSDEQKLLGQMLDREDNRNGVFRVVKQMITKNRDIVGEGCIKELDGKILTNEVEVKARWMAHFEKLLNEEFRWKKESLSAVNMVSGPAEHITCSEVKLAIQKAQLGKAAGPSGVLAEMLKASGDVGVQWVSDLCNAIIYEGKIPNDWKKSWMVKIYKGDGDALECGSYRGIKLLDQVMKVLERIIANKIRSSVFINNMQFGFRPGKGTTDAIFIVRQVQERFLEKKKDLWMAFVYLEKAFDRVPREVVWWALRCSGVEEWLVTVIVAMYDNVTTTIKTRDGESDGFEVMVGVHQGSVLSPLLFIIVLEALSKEFRVGLPWELFYADDLCLIAETEEELVLKFETWKDGIEAKGLKINMNKTKVMHCKVKNEQAENTGKWPCGVCRKGVGANSIVCTVCKQWVHKRCSGIKGSLKIVGFECRKCILGDYREEAKKEVEIKSGEKIEYVSKFCYLGDTIGSAGGAEEASRARVRSAWAKFRELSPLLTARGASLKIKGKLYSIYVQSVMMYGSETWAMKVDDVQRLERTERMMIRWMCGVTLKDKKSSEDLRKRLGILSVSDRVRQGRLRWFGHVERRDADDWLSACRRLEVSGEKSRGRYRKTWNECVSDDLKKLHLRKEDVQDRVFWRNGIMRNVQPVQARKQGR